MSFWFIQISVADWIGLKGMFGLLLDIFISDAWTEKWVLIGFRSIPVEKTDWVRLMFLLDGDWKGLKVFRDEFLMHSDWGHGLKRIEGYVWIVFRYI